MSKYCELNLSQKRCFTILFLYSYFYYVVLFNCPFLEFCLDAFIMNKKVLLYSSMYSILSSQVCVCVGVCVWRRCVCLCVRVRTCVCLLLLLLLLLRVCVLCFFLCLQFHHRRAKSIEYTHRTVAHTFEKHTPFHTAVVYSST